MPYRNIHWVKLQLRLLDDERFFTMSEQAQLLYIKLLMLMGKCGGKVGLKWEILAQILRSKWTEGDFNNYFTEIRKNFPKVIINNGYVKVKGFKELHNQVTPRISQGDAGDVVDIDIEENKNKSREIIEVFRDAYRRRFAKEYIVSWAKDMSIMKGLLAILTIEEMKGYVCRFFELDDPFLQKAGYTIGVFKSQINKLRAPKAIERGDAWRMTK